MSGLSLFEQSVLTSNSNAGVFLVSLTVSWTMLPF